jgi:hypothetical protein
MLILQAVTAAHEARPSTPSPGHLVLSSVGHHDGLPAGLTDGVDPRLTPGSSFPQAW